MVALNVKVVSTTEVIWSGQAKSVSVPGVDGSIGILPGRQPLLALLKAGKTSIIDAEDAKTELDLPAGFVSLDLDVLTICVDSEPKTGQAEDAEVSGGGPESEAAA